MASIPAHHRPFYRPMERLAKLELKAARDWSLEQTAKRFFVCPKTIASWMKRLDECASPPTFGLLFTNLGVPKVRRTEQKWRGKVAGPGHWSMVMSRQYFSGTKARPLRVARSSYSRLDDRLGSLILSRGTSL